MDYKSSIENKISSVDWSSFNGPEYYDSEKAKQSLFSLVLLENEIDNSATYNEVLFCIGNNHAGTYYPAAYEAVKIISEILKESPSEISRNCALEIFIDLYCAFEPEMVGYTHFSFEELQSYVSQEIESLDSKLREMVSLSNESDRNKNLANELLDSIAEIRK